MRRLLLALTLLATGSCAQGPPECNCNAIRLSPADVPVRDVDGVIYANLCLARCQHADIDTTPVSGAAAGGPAPYNPRLIDAQAALGPADLTRYSAEGFRLVAKIKMQAGKAWTPRLARRAAGGMAAASAAGTKLHAARITDTGLLYLQPRSAAGASSGPVAGAAGAIPGPQFAPGFHGSLPDPAGNATGRQQASRRLLQPVGTDERWQVTSPTAHAFPWRAVGYIASGCSGSLIGPSTVLTAGHCVYDTTSRTFFKDLRFTPDMHDGGRHCSRRRGRTCLAWDTPAAVPWATVTTWFNNAGPAQQCEDGSLRCQSLQDFAWDLALITLKRAAGNQFGYLGFGYTCPTTTYAVTSAGYPSDLDPTMTHMYATSGTLNPFSGCLAKNDVAGVVSSDLDTAPGQSGSPIWESNSKGYYVRATHNAGGPYHRTIVKDYFDWIMQNRK